MKKFVALFLIVFIIANNLAVFAQEKPSLLPETSEVVDLGSDNPLDDFPEKGLPVPYFVGDNPSDELAVSLAKEIFKYDEKSLSVLMGTLQKAGFYIKDTNQKILYKPTVMYDMELAFYDFEVAGMLKSSGIGVVTNIKKFAELLSANVEGISAETVGKAILEDLRNARNSENQRIRFAATLIFELGKQFPTPVDLTKTTPENSTINIIQSSLIEKILLGDLIDAYTKATEESSFYKKSDLFKSPNKVLFANADFRKKDLPNCNEIIDEMLTIQKSEKNIYKGADKIKTFIETLKNGAKYEDGFVKGSKAGKAPYSLQPLKDFGIALKLVNIALAWLKLLMAYLNIKIELSAQNPPLKRTKSRNIGEWIEITAKISMDLLDKKTTDYLNCVGKAIEYASGLKLSVPKAGSLSGNTVTWEVVTSGNSSSKFLEPPAFLRSVDGSPDTSKEKTNENGESKVKLWGKAQREDLTNEPVIPVIKNVDLRASVALEKMDFGKDAGKLGKLLLEEYGYNLLIGALEVLPEMFGKMKLRAKSLRVPVRDYTPCSEDWGGEINIERTYTKPTNVLAGRLANGNSTGSGSRIVTILEKVDITLNPRKQEEMNIKPPNPATLFVSGKYTNIFTGEYDDNPCCGETAGSFDTKFTDETTEEFSEWRSEFVNVNYILGSVDRNFSIGFLVFAGSFETKIRRGVDVIYTQCSLEEQQEKHEEKKGRKVLNFTLDPGRYGERFPSPAGDGLRGSKVLPQKDGSIVTWKWQLVRCKK